MKTSMAALEAGDFSETYANLLTAAEEGNATAQFEIGSKLNAGLGAEINAHAHAKWFRAAAEQSHAGGQIFLDRMLAEGVGVERKMAEAWL